MATISQAKRIVVKIGSALLVDAKTGLLRQEWLASLAKDVADFRARGTDIVIVSSGSIALGRAVLRLGGTDLTLEQSQAAAAVGQIQLARAYEQHLAPYGVTTGQVLLTLEDSADRRRYLNSRATLGQLLKFGVVPIVNENDTVATDEIRYGDNDRLAAQIAVTAGADNLVLLSDVDGFYSGNPKIDPSATRFEVIKEVTTEIEAMASDATSGMSKGGMITKLMAAKMAMGAGCAMAITLGSPNNPLKKLENGSAATWFLPSEDPKTARKRWISSLKPQGTVTVDEGAIEALLSGKSLLPAGVLSIDGIFARGELVRILSKDGTTFGCGLIAFDSFEAIRILGCHTKDIEEILGYASRGSLIHRDDMVL